MATRTIAICDYCGKIVFHKCPYDGTKEALHIVGQDGTEVCFSCLLMFGQRYYTWNGDTFRKYEGYTNE